MLFNSTTELQKYTALAAMNFAAISPVLDTIEEDCLIPYLGRELYDEILEAIKEDPVPEKYGPLQEICKKIVAPFAVYKYIPKGQLQIGTNGILRADNETLKTPYGYQIAELREAYLEDGELAIERLLAYLEANKANFTSWADSEAYKNYNSLIIRSGAEFKQLFTMQRTPHRNYWSMRSKMQDIQFAVKQSIGADKFDELLTGQAASGLDEDNTHLLLMIKKAISYITIAEAVPYLNCRMDANGITMLSSVVANSQKDNTNRMAANDKALSNLIISAKNDGDEWLSRAKKQITELKPPPVTQSHSNKDCNNYKSTFSF